MRSDSVCSLSHRQPRRDAGDQSRKVLEKYYSSDVFLPEIGPEEDFSRYLELASRAFDERMVECVVSSLEQSFTQIGDERRFVKLEADGALLGFCGVYRQRSMPRHFGFADWMCVSREGPKHASPLLFRAMISLARSMSVTRLLMEVTDSSHSVTSSLDRLGIARVGTICDVYGPGLHVHQYLFEI